MSIWDLASQNPVTRVALSATSSENVLYAGVSGKSIRVLAGVMVSAGTVAGTFNSDVSGGSPVQLTGAMNFGPTSVVTLPFCPLGHFPDTAKGKSLVLNLSGSTAINGYLVVQTIG